MELRDAIQPSRGRYSLGENRRGSTLNKRIIDGTARRALRTLTSGLMAGMTSPSRAWFRLGFYDEGAMDDPEVKAYLYVAQQRMYTVLRGSNIYRTLANCYADLGLYGTFGGLIVGDFENVIHSHAFPVGMFRIEENELGTVDVLHRDVRRTVGQLVGQFGLDACSDRVKNLYKQNRIHDYIDVTHAVEVRRERDPMSPLSINKPFASFYWEKGRSDNLLQISGFGVNPILAPRWERVDGEAYSVASPGMDALGDAVMLQQQHRDMATAIQMSYKPPMQAPAGFTKHFRNVPGGITTVDASDLSKGGIRPAFEVKPDVSALQMSINETQRRISQSFFEDLFLMTSMSDRRQVTAREIAERHEEKLLVLGPVLESLDHGLLQPIIEATFHYMQEAEILPPAPDAIVGKPIKVEYISLLAQAQRAVGVASIERTVGFAGSLAQIRPDVLDNLNPDVMLREFVDQVGPPPAIILAPKDVEAARQARAQAEQAATMMQQAQPLANAAKLISEANQMGQAGLERGARAI